MLVNLSSFSLIATMRRSWHETEDNAEGSLRLLWYAFESCISDAAKSSLTLPLLVSRHCTDDSLCENKLARNVPQSKKELFTRHGGKWCISRDAVTNTKCREKRRLQWGTICRRAGLLSSWPHKMSSAQQMDDVNLPFDYGLQQDLGTLAQLRQARAVRVGEERNTADKAAKKLNLNCWEHVLFLKRS